MSSQAPLTITDLASAMGATLIATSMGGTRAALRAHLLALSAHVEATLEATDADGSPHLYRGWATE